MPDKKSNRLFRRSLVPSVVRVFVVLAVLALLVPVYTYTRGRLQPAPALAAAGINHQINFQGKLVNPDGTNVTDGSYSIVFSIYSVASAGTAIWTETQSVTLSNGIFQVMLGSVTTLPGSVDFNTDNIYLGIKVGTDAEMTPRVRFGAVPQAFNAEKLGGLDKTGFIQNTTTMQSSANLYIQSGAVGNVTAKLQALASQTADILQVRNSGDTATVFAINPSGTITAGTWQGSTVAVAYGGTGATTLTSNGVLYGNGTGAIGATAAGTTGQCLTANTGSAPTWGTCGGSLFTDAGTFTYLTSVTDDLVLGGSTVAGASLFFDESAANLYLGTSGSLNGTLTFYNSAGTTGAYVSTNASGDLNLAAPSGTVTVGNGSGNIQVVTSVGTDNIIINSAGSLTVTSNGASTFNINGFTVDATEFNRLDGKDAALVDTNDAVATAITGVGTITAGTWQGTTVGVPYGGTGATTLTSNGVLFGSGTGAIQATAAGTTGQCLVATTAAAPSWGTCLSSEADTLATVTGRGATTSTATTFTGGATIRGVTVDSATSTNDKIAISVTTTAGTSFTGTITNSDLTVARTYTLQDNSGVVALGTAANSLFFTTTGATNVTLPTTGTLCSTATCLTAEADTLATVTGRGATTATASTFTGGATIRGLTVDTATATQDRIVLSVGTAGAARFDGTITTGVNDLTAARTWTLPDASGTFITTGNLTGITATGTITSGTWQGTAVGVGFGGTGLTSYTVGDLLYASGATTLSKLADVATGSCLISGGVGVAPSWGSCSASGITGSGTNGQVAYFNGGSTLTSSANLLFNGTTLTAGALVVGTTANQQTTISAGAGNHVMEIGRTDGTSSTPVIDFHSGATAVDYDVRFMSSGGNGTIGQGTLSVQAAVSNFSGSLTVATGASIVGGASIQGTLNVYTATATDDRILTAVTAGGAARFDGTITNKDLTAARTYSLQDASGVVALGTAANALFFTTSGATNVTLPTSGTLCNTTSCGTAGSGYVQFAPASVQTDTTTNSSIFINKTGASGNILQLQNGGTDVFTINNSGSVTVAAGKSLTITGSGTRPGSPTDGMLYYDTTTKQLLVYNATKVNGAGTGGWQADRTGAILVAASNSSQAAKDAADYIADGNTVAATDGDQVQIQAALDDADPAGSGRKTGKVYLFPGTYVADATILIKNNTIFSGSGIGTVIELADLDVTDNLIENFDTSTGTNITVQDMKLNGRNDLNTAGTQKGIYFTAMGAGTGASARIGAAISNVQAINFRTYGIQMQSSANSTLTANTALGNGSTGIWLLTCSAMTVTSNMAQGNGNGGFIFSTVTSSVITGNTSINNTNSGFFVESFDNNTLANNTATNNTASGFYIDFFSNYNTISNNMALTNTIEGIGFHGTSSNNTATGNTLTDNGGATTNNGIVNEGSDSNIITNNYITDTSATTTNYAISITSSTSDTTYLSGNTLGTGSINDLGTGTIYGGQLNSSGIYNIQDSMGTVVKSTSNSTSTFLVQNAVGAELLQVDTTANNNNLVTNPSLEVNTTGWNARTGTTLSRTTTAGTYYYGIAAAQGVNTATTGAGINYPIVLSPNTMYTATIMAKETVTGLNSFGYAADGATETTYVNTNANANSTANNWQQSCVNFTTPATVNGAAYIFLKQNDATARTMYLDGLRIMASTTNYCALGGGAAAYQESQITLGPAGTSVLIGASDSNTPTNLNAALFVQQNRGSRGLVVQGTPENDFSSGIFQVLNAAGTTLLAVNNLTDSTSISGGSSFYNAAALTVTAGSSGITALRAQGVAGQTADILQVRDSSSNVLFSVGSTGSVTVAASQTIRLVGGITSTRPASPSDGMLYYDTTTKQLLVYNASKPNGAGTGGWQADRETNTKIIAPSNASQTAKDSADVILTGTADQTLINTALTAAAGGKVYILEGTVTVTGSISVPNNTTLSGAGPGTKITLPNTSAANVKMIVNTDATTGTGVTIQDLRIDGNNSNQTNGGLEGIVLTNMGGGAGATLRQGAKLSNLWINNMSIDGIELITSANTTIVGNTFENTFSDGVWLNASKNNTIMGNLFQGVVNYGVDVDDTSSYTTITGNTFEGGDTPTGGFGGVDVEGPYNTVSGNTFANLDATGVAAYTSNNNTITGNTFHNNGQPDIQVYTSYNTISGNNISDNLGNNGGSIDIIGSYNTITGNNIKNSGGASFNDAISLGGSTPGSDNNTITGNTITDASATTNNRAISLYTSLDDNNYLADNNIGTGIVYNLGTGTIYGGQLDGTGKYRMRPLRLDATANLGTTAGNSTGSILEMHVNTTNDVYLSLSGYRTAAGSDWTTTSLILGRTTDVTGQGYVAFYGTSICINTSSCTKTFGVSGTIGASGTITASTTPDIAETIPAAPDVEAADVVMADPNNTERVIKSQGVYNGAAVGVISDGTSSFMINSHANSEGGPLTGAPLVLAGRVPVKVTNEGGAIKPGDYLTSSSTPGKAMKATHAGPTIGKALGFFNGTTGTVLALINVSYYEPTTSDALQGSTLSVTGNASIGGSLSVSGGLNVSGATTLASLTVTGNETVQGNLVVMGNIETQSITVNGHIITSGSIPVVAVGAAVGQAAANQAAPFAVVDGNDSAGTISVTTGSQNLTNGVLAHISFAQAFNGTYKVVLSASNDPAGLLRVHTVKTATGFDIVANDPASALTQYDFDYIVLGAQATQ